MSRVACEGNDNGNRRERSEMFRRRCLDTGSLPCATQEARYRCNRRRREEGRDDARGRIKAETGEAKLDDEETFAAALQSPQ